METSKKQQDLFERLSVRFKKLSNTSQFLICAGGVFFCYLLQAMAGEYLFFNTEFSFGYVLTFYQFSIYAILSGITFMSQRKSVSKIKLDEDVYSDLLPLENEFPSWEDEPTKSKPLLTVPIQVYFLISVFGVGSAAFAHQSLNFLNYPTVIMFKSCKVIFVMVAGVFVIGKTYTLREYVASFCLVIGLILLSINNVATSVAFDATGVLLICLALLCDSMYGNLQEKVLKQNKAPLTEVICVSHASGALITLLISMFVGQLVPAIQMCFEKPFILMNMTIYGMLGYFGIYFVFFMLQLYGAFITTTTTSCRKCLSIILSYIIFPKPFTMLTLSAVGFVVAGIMLNVYAKTRKPEHAKGDE